MIKRNVDKRLPLTHSVKMATIVGSVNTSTLTVIRRRHGRHALCSHSSYTGSQLPVVDSSNVGSSIAASTESSSCNIDISATPLSKKMKLIQKHTVSSQSHPDLRLRDQIKAYIRCEPEGEDDPLSFWRSNSSKFLQ